MTTTFETAKVGDRVWDIVRGWGTIKSTSFANAKGFPILVKLDNNPTDASYNLQGIYYIGHLKPSLYWDEIKFEAPKKPVVVPVKDTLVDCDGYLRYSAGTVNDHGDLWCYPDGRTSATREGRNLTCWSNWEVV